MYAILSSWDGKHFNIMKKGKDAGKMWDFFILNRDIRQHILLNRFAKFRLVNLDTNMIIGESPKKK